MTDWEIPFQARTTESAKLFCDLMGKKYEPSSVFAGRKMWIGASSRNERINGIALALRRACQKAGAIVNPAYSEDELPGQTLRRIQLKSSDWLAMLAVTPGVSAEALEISAIDSQLADRMTVYIPKSFDGGYVYKCLTREYLVDVKRIDWSSSNSSDVELACSMFSDFINKVAQQSAEAAVMRTKFAPTIAIITALEVEFLAIRHCLDDDWWLDTIRTDDGYSTRDFICGKISSQDGSSHSVVVALCGKGNNKAAVRATIVLDQFPTVKDIFMVGVAAGVPYIEKPEFHVRLGDIVVSDETGVIQYDFMKMTSRGNNVVATPTKPSAGWINRARHYLLNQREDPPYWNQIDTVLQACRWKRPRTDILDDTPWGRGQIAHPRNDRNRRPGRPKIIMGGIASSNIVLKTARFREKLRDRYQVRAVEMEASGISDATWEQGKGFLIVRGICDYANDGKNKTWQPYAATAAAAFCRELIASMPTDKPDRFNQEVRYEYK